MKKILLFILLLFLSSSWLCAAEKLSTEELIRNLQSKDPKDRSEAAKELGERGEKLGVDALIQATKDPDETVQLEVVRALGKINDPRQVSALSQAVRNTKGNAQKEGIHLLTEHYIPSPDQNGFQELWGSIENLFNPPDTVIVEPWIQVDAEAVDTLLFVLDDKNSENRIQAAATLGILRATPALPRLTYYLKSPNEKVVRTCVRSIGYIGKPEAGANLVPLLKHKDDEIVRDSARVLGRFRYKPALRELQDLLDYSNKKDDQRVALQAISRIGDPSSETIIRKNFDSDDKYMRQYAIEGVGRMGLQNYIETLEKIFQREKSQQLKLAQSFSLFALGRTAYMDTIVRSLGDPLYKDQVRGYLKELGEKAVPSLAGYLKANDKDARIRVIRILGDMHQPSAIPYLEPYLKDEDLDIAQAATDAIRELKQVQNIPS